MLASLAPWADGRTRYVSTRGKEFVSPNGKPLTNYKRGAGPHTGVHLILVRTDLAAIIHRHPPVGPNGRLSDTIVFPEPGTYRVVVYAYPMTGRPDRQLPQGWDDIPGARGCTPETCGFRDHHKELAKLHAEVFGVSTQVVRTGALSILAGAEGPVLQVGARPVYFTNVSVVLAKVITV